MWPVGQGSYNVPMGRNWHYVSSNGNMSSILRDWFLPTFTWGGTPHEQGELNVANLPIDDLGAVIIAIICLLIIAFGKETSTVSNVLLTVVGFIFGKYTRKSKR